MDDKEHTADKVAPSVADLINKKFSKGLSDEKLITRFSEKLKTSKPGCPTEPAILEAFNANTKLCPAAHLREYLDKTKELKPVLNWANVCSRT